MKMFQPTINGILVHWIHEEVSHEPLGDRVNDNLLKLHNDQWNINLTIENSPDNPFLYLGQTIEYISPIAGKSIGWPDPIVLTLPNGTIYYFAKWTIKITNLIINDKQWIIGGPILNKNADR